jgi:hypothetical protein
LEFNYFTWPTTLTRSRTKIRLQSPVVIAISYFVDSPKDMDGKKSVQPTRRKMMELCGNCSFVLLLHNDRPCLFYLYVLCTYIHNSACPYNFGRNNKCIEDNCTTRHTPTFFYFSCRVSRLHENCVLNMKGVKVAWELRFKYEKDQLTTLTMIVKF